MKSHVDLFFVKPQVCFDFLTSSALFWIFFNRNRGYLEKYIQNLKLYSMHLKMASKYIKHMWFSKTSKNTGMVLQMPYEVTECLQSFQIMSHKSI